MTPAGIEPATCRFVTQYLDHCATAVPIKSKYCGEKPVSEYSGYCYKLQSGNIKILNAIKQKVGKKGRELNVTGS